jgi:hypothetical protein
LTEVYQTAYETLAAAVRSAYRRDRGLVENVAQAVGEDVRQAPDVLDLNAEQYAQLPIYVGMACSLRSLVDLVDRLDHDLAAGFINDLTDNTGGGK